jgi:hypothetical protein
VVVASVQQMETVMVMMPHQTQVVAAAVHETVSQVRVQQEQ